MQELKPFNQKNKVMLTGWHEAQDYVKAEMPYNWHT